MIKLIHAAALGLIARLLLGRNKDCRHLIAWAQFSIAWLMMAGILETVNMNSEQASE